MTKILLEVALNTITSIPILCTIYVFTCESQILLPLTFGLPLFSCIFYLFTCGNKIICPLTFGLSLFSGISMFLLLTVKLYAHWLSACRPFLVFSILFLVAVKLYAHWLSFFHPVSFCIYLWQSNYTLTDFRFPSMFYLRPFLVSSTFVLLTVKLNAHCISFFLSSW